MYASPTSSPAQTSTVEKYLPMENFGSHNALKDSEVEGTYGWQLHSKLAWPIHVPCTGRQIDLPLVCMFNLVL